MEAAITSGVFVAPITMTPPGEECKLDEVGDGELRPRVISIGAPRSARGAVLAAGRCVCVSNGGLQDQDAQSSGLQDQDGRARSSGRPPTSQRTARMALWHSRRKSARHVKNCSHYPLVTLSLPSHYPRHVKNTQRPLCHVSAHSEEQQAGRECDNPPASSTTSSISMSSCVSIDRPTRPVESRLPKSA